MKFVCSSQLRDHRQASLLILGKFLSEMIKFRYAESKFKFRDVQKTAKVILHQLSPVKSETNFALFCYELLQHIAI